MRDNRKDRPHQPRVQPQNLENGGFQQSYPTGSYNHQPQQPTNSVPGYQHSCPSNIANSLEESSAVEGYPPNQNRYTDSYDQPHPLLHQSAASLPSRSGISHQHNSIPPQSAAPLPPRSSISHQHNSLSPQPATPLAPRFGSSLQHNSLPPNNYQGGQPSIPGGTPPVQGHARCAEANTQATNRASEGHITHYNEQQPPVLANYQPSAPSTQQDDEDEPAPVAYPAHPINTSPVNREHVQPVQNIYEDPHTPPSQKPMVQPQPSLPLQQPPINFSSLSDVTKPPDGYPTVGQHQPSTETQSSKCCCTIL